MANSFLQSLFDAIRQSNPNATDDEIKAHLGNLLPSKNTPSAETSPLSVSPSTMDITSPSPTPSSFDVATSDDTVKNIGKPESLPSAASLPSLPMAVDNTPPAPMAPIAPQMPVEAPKPIPVAPAIPKPAVQAASPVNPLTSSSSNDFDTRQAELDAANAKKKASAIPEAIGGIADAIGNAAKPFGGQGSSGTGERIHARAAEEAKTHVSETDTKIKTDPNSDISKSYREMVLQISPNLRNDPTFQKMSAQDIGEKLPLIDTMMKAKAAEESKKLGLAQVKATKDLQNTIHETERQDKLEKQTRDWVDNLAKARNGQVGQQDAKVNQSIHLLQLMDQYKDPAGNYKIPNSQYGELALGLANLISPTGATSEGTRKELEARTAKGDINGALTYLGLDPKTLGASTQSVFLNLRDSIVRQGQVSQKLRDKYIQDQRETAPSGAKQETKDRLLNRTYGNSLDEYNNEKSKPPALTPEDKRQIAWAKDNPANPMSKQILSLHGMR